MQRNAMKAQAHIRYAQRPDATTEAEIPALANVYRFVLACHTRKEATSPGSPDDAKEIKNDSRHHDRST